MYGLIFSAFNYLSVEWDVHVAILDFNLSNAFKALRDTTILILSHIKTIISKATSEVR